MESILVLDDEESVGRLLDRILVRNGYECFFVTDTAKARELMECRHFGLIVTDICMPGESGLDFARWVRMRYPEIAIVVLTGIAETETAQQALELGVYGYILKPFEPNQVLISVINAIRRRDLEMKARCHRQDLETTVAERTAELEMRLSQLGETQKDLRESEKRYRTAIELSNDGVAISSRGKYLYVNRKFVEIHGYDLQEEFIGKPVVLFSHPDEIEKVKSVQATREAGGDVPSRHETRRIRKDGKTIIVEISASTVVYGGELSSLAFVRDVTQRKKTEEALKESEERFRTIAESAQEAIIQVGRGGSVAYWNLAAEKIFGYTAEEVLGRPYFLLLPIGKRRSAHQKAFERFEETGMGAAVGRINGTVAWRKNGERFPIDLSVSAVRIRGLWNAILILRDISERKALEGNLLGKTKSLEEAREKLEAKNLEIEYDRRKLASALDEISSLIQKVAREKDFSIRFGNPALAKCNEVMNCRETACPCYGKETVRCWQVSGTHCNGEIQGSFAQKIDGCCRQCTVFVEVTRDPVYKIGEHFNNMMHILEGKNQSLQAAYQDVKNSQTLIIQQEKMASIGQLAAGVAHEINNPTGFISSNLRTLSEYLKDLTGLLEAYRDLIRRLKTSAAADGSGLELLKDIEKLESDLDVQFILEDSGKLVEESSEGTERIKKIVLDLKDFAHPGKQELVYADINRNLESTLNIVWNEIKYKAKVARHFGVLPEVRCYPQQLNQVFMNLLVNAAQAIEREGEIVVATAADNGYVAVRIRDNGVGIAEENLSRIFDPFFTTKDVGKGTGLGLNVAYNIINKHGGTIEVESTVGKGTTFTVRIPAEGPERMSGIPGSCPGSGSPGVAWNEGGR